jgi:hypothetical protein
VVSLLMWAGANPRSRGPALDDADHIEDAEWHTTALAEACYSGSVESLKRLKPSTTDDLCAASTTFAGQRQLFLPVKGPQRERRWRPQWHSVIVVGWSRPLSGTFFSPIKKTRMAVGACGKPSAVFQGPVGAFCASTGPAASTASGRAGREQQAVPLWSTTR